MTRQKSNPKQSEKWRDELHSARTACYSAISTQTHTHTVTCTHTHAHIQTEGEISGRSLAWICWGCLQGLIPFLERRKKTKCETSNLQEVPVLVRRGESTHEQVRQHHLLTASSSKSRSNSESLNIQVRLNLSFSTNFLSNFSEQMSSQ